MTTDEGTPKRRRGLFRRDRGNAAASTDERRGSDSFDDPWSASAWDDWDDDFTNVGARSSVPAAAAPRPEAVDAWLRSEADDFDTAARRNTKRWGGDANRPQDTSATGLRSLRAETESLPTADPTATVIVPGGRGHGGLRDNATTESAPPEFAVPDDAETRATAADAPVTAADTEPSKDQLTDWATDPDLLAIADDDHANDADDDAVDDDADDDAVDNDAVAETSELADESPADVDHETVNPRWEPVVELVEQDHADHVEAVPVESAEVTTDVLANEAAEATTVESSGGWPGGEPEITDHGSEEASADLVMSSPGDQPAPTPMASTIDDELKFDDALEPEQLDFADMATLDEAPEVLSTPLASWAPANEARTGSETSHPTAGVSGSGNDPYQTDTSASPDDPSTNDIAAAEDTAAEEPFVAAEEVRVRLPGFAGPVAPPVPVSRFVTVSVISEDDQPDIEASPGQPEQAGPISSVAAATNDEPAAPVPPGASASPVSSAATASPVSSEATPTPLDGPAPVGTPATDVTGAATGAAPKITSRRWAALAAEFGSDGDLDDSFPGRPRADVATPAPAAPVLTADDDDAERPVVESVPTAPTTGPVESVAPAVDEVAPAPETGTTSGDDLPVEPGLEVALPTTPDSGSTTDSRTSADSGSTTGEGAGVEPTNEPTEPEVDPWAQPPLPSARPDARTRPVRADPPTSSDDDPWTRPPRRTERPAAPDRSYRSAAATAVAPPAAPTQRRPQPPTTAPPAAADKPRPSTAVEPLDADGSVSPDISGFAGFLGTGLIGFAIVRVVLTLLGDQPVIPARFTGREASLLRIGESFGSSGSAWPVALVVGTILLTVPSFLAVRSHLRRWAPIVGLGAATGVVAIAIGALRFVAGRRLGSASTIKLVSDAIVGPIGFGVLTLVAVGLAIRSHRR